jgi:hypothetical protein
MPIYCVKNVPADEDSQDLTEFILALEKVPGHYKARESDWLIATQWTQRQLRDHFENTIHKADTIGILQVQEATD